MFWVLGLPHLSHPVFAVEGLERATLDTFWAAIDLGDPHLDPDRTPRELRALGATRVSFFGRSRR
jgi:hypothetical protein